jgi:hypothetical protein
MHVSTEAVVVQRHVCSACQMDENGLPGAVCRCYEEEVRLSVVGEVTPPRDGRVHLAHEFIHILSILDMDSGHAWSPIEMDDLSTDDLEGIRSQLWFKYLEVQAPEFAVKKEADRVCEAIQAHIRWALEIQHTSVDHVQEWLAAVRAQVLNPKSQEAA